VPQYQGNQQWQNNNTAQTQTNTNNEDEEDSLDLWAYAPMHVSNQKVDKNGDGLIDDNEASAYAAFFFDMIDLDGDSKLNFIDFADGHIRRAGPGVIEDKGYEYPYINRQKARFKIMDKDGDEFISREEYMQAFKEHYENAKKKAGNQMDIWAFRTYVRP
jgi:hypothetical protein